MSHQDAIDYLKALNARGIAALGGCTADNKEARDYLLFVRDSTVRELIDNDGSPNEETLRQLASDSPDVHNVTRIMEAVGTMCIIDSSELTTDETDMVTLAGYVLFDQALKIQDALVESYRTMTLAGSEPTA